jgi:hypothetical protein
VIDVQQHRRACAERRRGRIGEHGGIRATRIRDQRAPQPVRRELPGNGDADGRDRVGHAASIRAPFIPSEPPGIPDIPWYVSRR